MLQLSGFSYRSASGFLRIFGCFSHRVLRTLTGNTSPNHNRNFLERNPTLYYKGTSNPFGSPRHYSRQCPSLHAICLWPRKTLTRMRHHGHEHAKDPKSNKHDASLVEQTPKVLGLHPLDSNLKSILAFFVASTLRGPCYNNLTQLRGSMTRSLTPAT